MSENAALFGAVSLLERSTTYLLGNLQLVRPALLSRPTPCEGWDLRALLWHVDDSFDALSSAAEAGFVEPSAPSLLAPSLPLGSSLAPSLGAVGPSVALYAPDPISAVRDGARRVLGSWSAARPDVVLIGRAAVSSTIVATAGAIEIAAHGWDIARACGWRRPVPRSLAEEMLDLLPLFAAEPYRYRCFAPPVAVSDGECAGDRLIASLGRRPPDPVERRYLQSRAALLLASQHS